MSTKVTSTTVSSSPGTDATPSDSGVRAISNGQVEDWGALERILHDALYMQVGHLPVLSSVTCKLSREIPACTAGLGAADIPLCHMLPPAGLGGGRGGEPADC